MYTCFNLPSSPDVVIIHRIIVSEPKTQKSVATGFIKWTLRLNFKGNGVPRCSYPVCQSLRLHARLNPDMLKHAAEQWRLLSRLMQVPFLVDLLCHNKQLRSGRQFEWEYRSALLSCRQCNKMHVVWLSCTYLLCCLMPEWRLWSMYTQVISFSIALSWCLSQRTLILIRLTRFHADIQFSSYRRMIVVIICLF